MVFVSDVSVLTLTHELFIVIFSPSCCKGGMIEQLDGSPGSQPRSTHCTVKWDI